MRTSHSGLRPRRILGLTAVLLALLSISVGVVWATDGFLPGGTSISVDIDQPPNGAVRASPPGNVQLQGTAKVGESVPVPNNLLVYVLDVSFSTQGSAAGCGGDQNGDGLSNKVLDCEIAAAKALNNSAVSFGTVGQVGVAVFGGHDVLDPNDTGGAAADVSPAAGDQLVTGPATDADSAGGRDIEQVLSSAISEGDQDGGVTAFSLKNVGSDGTNFAKGLQAAVAIAAASDRPNKIIVFMSDGLANTGPTVASVAVPAGVVIQAFAVGAASDCTSNPNGLGSLNDVAAKGAAGSACTPVATVASLPGIVPGVISAKLLKLERNVDGGVFVGIPAADISGGPLPAEDPVTVSYSHLVAGLAPGIHTLCVKASGSDAGGQGSVQECITVKVVSLQLTPETDTNPLGPGQSHSVVATVAAGTDGGVAGLTVSFAVLSGPNAGASGTSSTNAQGQATFTYTAAQGPAGLGIDTIQACFTDAVGNKICDQATKEWRDTTPPVVACVETVNPAGRNVPPAGSTTLPGAKGGVNEDGFYLLTATDAVDPNPTVLVTDSGSGTVFGPFPSGTRIKYTETRQATPTQKKIGSSPADAIDWHIIGNGDPVISSVDASGNTSVTTACLVPPPPK